MQLALNYSPQAVELLRAGQIAVDRFKCPDWPDLIATAREDCPVYVHFDLGAGTDTRGPVDWERVTRLVAQTNTPYVNVHLAPTSEDFPAIPLDTTDSAHIEQVTGRLIRDVAAFVDYFGPERVIVENVPYRTDELGSVLRPCVEPAVICRVVEETGCGFLLDVPHARISAMHMALDEWQYITALPVQAIRELHITGMAYIEGIIHDHLPLTTDDWAFFERVMNHIHRREWPGPWIVAFEYGGIGPIFEWRSDSTAIAEQVPRLRDLVAGVTV